VLDERFTPLARKRLPTERERGYDHILARVTELVRELRELAPRCRRIGIGTPGSLSTRGRLLKNSQTGTRSAGLAPGGRVAYLAPDVPALHRCRSPHRLRARGET
jgi:predicted NBD/HSP70 family sugar kinase